MYFPSPSQSDACIYFRNVKRNREKEIKPGQSTNKTLPNAKQIELHINHAKTKRCKGEPLECQVSLFLLPPFYVLKVQVQNEQNQNGHPVKYPKGETRKELY